MTEDDLARLQALMAPPTDRSAWGDGPIRISNVNYKGDEYVTITNITDDTLYLQGWTLRNKDDISQAFTFKKRTKLDAHSSLDIFTKRGQTTHHFNSRVDIWDDAGGELELLNPAGEVVAGYAYGNRVATMTRPTSAM